MVKTLKDFSHWTEMKNQIIQADCLEGMKLIPDKSIDLVLTDPPYGIGVAKGGVHGETKTARKGFANKTYGDTSWDKTTPKKETFNEVFRMSKNQIVLGGNYFDLPPSPCWIVWHKKVNDNSDFADCELAWTSFKSAVRYFQYGWIGLDYINGTKDKAELRTHPTQKPVALMRWIIENYSKPGDLICDPFMGSWTTARACKDLGRDFIGFELSEDYCKVGEERLRQEVLF